MTIDLASTGIMRLERGAMQNWSDLSNGGASASVAVRELLAEVLKGVHTAVVVGPIAMDLVTEIAEMVDELTIVARSIPDCAAYAEALGGRSGVEVICGDLVHLDKPLGTFDAVISLGDLARVPSLEDEAPTWRAVFDTLVAARNPDGRFLVAVENELGLHRITSLRSRYTVNDNSAWDVTSTFDGSRPRTIEALRDVIGEALPNGAQVACVLPTWDEHTLLAWGCEGFETPARRLLDVLTLSSPALRRLGADPTRVTRAAVMAGRVAQLASGWLVVSGLPARDASIVASTTSGTTQTYRAGEVDLDPGAALFGEQLLDACAAGDSARLRTLLAAWWSALQSQEVDGQLDTAHADQRFDNLLVSDDVFTAVASAPRPSSAHDAAWDAVADFVHVINARGARHPWPAAMDARTMAATMGAMAGLEPCENLTERLGSARSQLDLPAPDVSGLLAVIERLEEKNKALASRADWFESKLNQRERELRSRASRSAAELAQAGRQQEALRKSAEDLRKSLTFRVGNVAMGPLKSAKKKFMG